MDKEKMLLVFPHLPNPRMIKRINALKADYKLEVIYWDRGISTGKVNQIPEKVKTTVIKRKANEGYPLRRIGTTLRVMVDVFGTMKRLKPNYLYLCKTDMLAIGVFYKILMDKKVSIIYEVSDLHSLMVDKQNTILKRIISGILKTMEKILCKYIQLLVVTSECFYIYFYKEFLDETRVIFIPNTPDQRVFTGFKRRKNDTYTVGFIGTVRYAKQLEMLLDVSEEIGVNVLIAGNGKDYKRILEYSKNMENVEIYGGYEYIEEIKSLYEKVDCIYSVYDAEKRNVQIALPNRLYEAVYTDTPIIAAKETYLGELVDKYGIGKTISYNCDYELAEVLRDLKNNREYTVQIARNTSRLKNIWNLEVYNKQLLDAIKQL